MTIKLILTECQKVRHRCGLKWVTGPMSKAFHKSDRTVLGTALCNERTTAFWCVPFLLRLPTLSILLQISQLLNALVLVRYFHHCLQSECRVRILCLSRRSMVVDKTEIVKFSRRQLSVEAFQDVPGTIAHTNRNDTKRNFRSLDNSLNRFWLLCYLAIGNYNEDVVFARLANNVHGFPDDWCQTGRSTQSDSSHNFIIQL